MIWTLTKSDKIIFTKGGPVLYRNGQPYSINILTRGRVEVRYKMDRPGDFTYHGLPIPEWIEN